MASLFTWIWVTLFGTGLGVEAFASFLGIKHGTLTWNVRHFVTGLYNPKMPRWLSIMNRVLLVALFTWLSGHLTAGWGP